MGGVIRGGLHLSHGGLHAVRRGEQIIINNNKTKPVKERRNSNAGPAGPASFSHITNKQNKQNKKQKKKKKKENRMTATSSISMHVATDWIDCACVL